jgi:hypothetical protein
VGRLLALSEPGRGAIHCARYPLASPSSAGPDGRIARRRSVVFGITHSLGDGRTPVFIHITSADNWYAISGGTASPM